MTASDFMLCCAGALALAAAALISAFAIKVFYEWWEGRQLRDAKKIKFYAEAGIKRLEKLGNA